MQKPIGSLRLKAGFGLVSALLGACVCQAAQPVASSSGQTGENLNLVSRAGLLRVYSYGGGTRLEIELTKVILENSQVQASLRKQAEPAIIDDDALRSAKSRLQFFLAPDKLSGMNRGYTIPALDEAAVVLSIEYEAEKIAVVNDDESPVGNLQYPSSSDCPKGLASKPGVPPGAVGGAQEAPCAIALTSIPEVVARAEDLRTFWILGMPRWVPSQTEPGCYERRLATAIPACIFEDRLFVGVPGISANLEERVTATLDRLFGNGVGWGRYLAGTRDEGPCATNSQRRNDQARIVGGDTRSRVTDPFPEFLDLSDRLWYDIDTRALLVTVEGETGLDMQDLVKEFGGRGTEDKASKGRIEPDRGVADRKGTCKEAGSSGEGLREMLNSLLEVKTGLDVDLKQLMRVCSGPVVRNPKGRVPTSADLEDLKKALTSVAAQAKKAGNTPKDLRDDGSALKEVKKFLQVDDQQDGDIEARLVWVRAAPSNTDSDEYELRAWYKAGGTCTYCTASFDLKVGE